MSSVGYNSIPQNPAPGNVTAASPLKHGSRNQANGRFSFPSVGRKLLSLLTIAAALVAVIFLVNNYVLELPRFSYHESRLVPRLSTSRNSNPFHFDAVHSHLYSDRKFSHWKARSSVSLLHSAIRSNICEVDSVTQEAVPTRDCSVGLWCRARLVVTKNDAGITVQAGYYIYTKRSKTMPITAQTKKRVKAVTPNEATKWAETLLEQLGTKLGEVDCNVSVSMIADAIMETKDVVASCSNTDDSLCSELVTLRECSCQVESVIEQSCYGFLTSDAQVGSFADLQGGCPEAKFMYNRIGVPLPYCSFTCPSDPSVIHTFDAEFHVQGGNHMTTPISREETQEALAVSIRPAYEKLFLPLPPCDHAPPFLDNYGALMHDIYSDSVMAEPEFFSNLTAELRLTYNYVYFLSQGTSRQDYINSVCSKLP
ncbi:hypothetical protein BWQ96_04793 [Gracilariopsis chorda]|uniref:Uncharacterized protein n=1 Tax=Gracilariopsis chorda TaxID=448386 RepID=A0A2V3ITP9_9FLOR|nr:hypothetical protein BWQ96_04793 [Gracilariopsis chorda]|eukprot:PXF45495.1 hypothetical protein BWQ96_04793 [Gracilariopsis chorda]